MADQNVDVAKLFQFFFAFHLNNLGGTIKSQGAAVVPSFVGEAERYLEWIKSVEKSAALTESTDVLLLLRGLYQKLCETAWAFVEQFAQEGFPNYVGGLQALGPLLFGFGLNHVLIKSL